MCIESSAKEKGDTWTYSGYWYADYPIYSTNTTGYGSGSLAFKTEDSVKAGFWVVGHTYRVTGSVSSATYSASNVDTKYFSCNWYWPTEKGNVFLCGFEDKYYAQIDLTFYYYGQDVGPVYEGSVINYTPGQIGYVTPAFRIQPDTVLTITDLGVVSSEYDLLERIDDTTTKTQETIGEVDKTTKGIWQTIKDFFGSFFENLINAVIGLFVPSAEEMSGLFDQLNDFFSDRFGFLYAPFDYMIRLMNVFLSSTGSTGLTLPGFSIMGHEVWGDLTYDLASDPLVGTVCGYVRTGTGILLAGYFIMFLQNFFKERFGSG